MFSVAEAAAVISLLADLRRLAARTAAADADKGSLPIGRGDMTATDIVARVE